MRSTSISGTLFVRSIVSIGILLCGLTAGRALADEIVIPVGEQKIIGTTENIRSLAVGDPSIADVRIVSSHQVRVLGSRAGMTDLLTWLGNKTDPTRYHLIVGSDITSLKAAFAGDPELVGVSLQDIGKTVVLGGRVPSAAAHDRALRLAG